MKKSVRRAAIISSFACVLITTSAHGTVDQPGTLDPFWATGSSVGAGEVITPISGSDDYATAMTLQPDGKVLLAGYCSNGTNNDFCAARFLPNGMLDTVWNGTGKVITPIGTGDDLVTAMTLQTDGKILVSGYCSAAFCAARYLPNGSLDTTWNGTGKVITTISSGGLTGNSANALSLQPDGKVLLAGKCPDGISSVFCAARYMSNGTLDTTWNGTGKVTTAVGSTGANAAAMALQPDGKVLLSGYCSNGGPNSNFCTARYLSNGTLDTTWNGTGKVVTPSARAMISQLP